MTCISSVEPRFTGNGSSGTMRGFCLRRRFCAAIVENCGVAEAKGWHSPDVWSRPVEIDGNIARQLHVPTGVFDAIQESQGELVVSNQYGTWPAAAVDRPFGSESLWLRLPIGAKVGDALRSASSGWNRPADLEPDRPYEVLETYQGAINFNEGTEQSPGLRPPQLGAIHAVLGYWTTRRLTPGTVVMPTGTGKTDTMLGLLVAARPERLLVVVPSDALREQIAAAFDRLGVLQRLGIVAPPARRPVVGRLLHGFKSAENANQFADTCNVVVTTPAALHASPDYVIREFLAAFSHLFVDEAHHVAAASWTRIRNEFGDRRVVQFTATPFREDGRHLQGTIIYSFPLREAQSQNLFSRIDFTSVVDFENPDRALATAAVGRLRRDLEAGYDHVLMARVQRVTRAKEIFQLYSQLASDLGVAVTYSALATSKKKAAVKALRNREARIVVCVDMLGEGFDLPALKVAAVHEPHKSLGVTLQFIGRFARTSADGTYGPAALFVARNELEADPRLRRLYAEDPEWNAILRDVSETAVDAQRKISEFEAGFGDSPDEVAIQSLMPKMSSVVYRTPTSEWNPFAVSEYFGEESLLTDPIGYNAQAGVAWFVLRRRNQVRWAQLETVEEVNFELYVLYFDSGRRLLYINNSANDGVFEGLAAAVIGDGAVRFNGTAVYRVMADIQRLVPTNVGVLDSRSHFRRFSMHVGSDVTESFTEAEAGTKTQTNISGSGYRGGDRVNISASQKGRIWSHAAASSLKEWCDWCDDVGTKLLDDTITIEHVIGNFIMPEPLNGRPEGVLLGLEWPWELHLQNAETMRLEYQERTFEAVYCDLVPDTSSSNGSFRFAVVNEAWEATYEILIDAEGNVEYRCVEQDEIVVVRPRSELPLSSWLNMNGLLLILTDDRVIEGGLLYQPRWERPPFNRSDLTTIDWVGTNFKVEAQTARRLPESIQRRAVEQLMRDSGDEQWAVVLDDDGSGEIADLVALRIDDEGLLVRLVHCKYSKDETAGARVDDLYELCGQAQKSVAWRRSDLGPFFKELGRRAQRKHQRTGVDPFEVGDAATLLRIQANAQVLRRRMEIVIVQPGLSRSKASPQQLDLLAACQSYLRTTINAPLIVWCSP